MTSTRCFARRGPARLALAALLLACGLRAQAAKQLFDKICAAGADRTLLFEQFEALGDPALELLRSELRAYVRALIEQEQEQDILGLGGGAGGRFGGRVFKLPEVPTRVDPLKTYTMSGEFDFPVEHWAFLHRRQLRVVANAEARITLVLEGLRRFGPRAQGAIGDLIKLAQSELRNDYPNAFLVRALVALGPRALPAMSADPSALACRFALARSGAPGMRVLMQWLRENADDLVSLQWTCKAIAAADSWPEGVSAGPLLDCAFHDRSRVHDAARAALAQHAETLRGEIARWHAPEFAGKKQERFAYALLGEFLGVEGAFRVVRRLAGRPRDEGRSRRRLGYEILARRARDFVKAGLGAKAVALLEKRSAAADGSILETVSLLVAHASMRRASGKANASSFPDLYRKEWKGRAWQRRIAALRGVQRGDEEVASEIVPLLDDGKLDVRIDAWHALAKLRLGANAELTKRLRARIENLVLDFDTKSYTNAQGLVTRAALRAIPALEARVGPALLDCLRAGLRGKSKRSWWRREVFRVIAGLGQHARPLAKDVLEHGSVFVERAFAIAATHEAKGPALAAFQKIARPRLVGELLAWCRENGRDAWIHALADGMRACKRANYEAYALDWTDHAAFAALHAARAELLPADLRDVSLRALGTMGAKARGVRARLEALRDREKSRERRAALDGVLAAIAG